MTLLTIDIGAGTQDILLFREDIELEGSTKLILPSQTVVIAQRIDRAGLSGKDIFLKGRTMGGGACVEAIRKHLAAGLKVYATPQAAATINDNLDRVASMGVVIQDQAPPETESIDMGDIDIPALRKAFHLFDIDLPDDIAVAVQDHGFSPNRSNRVARFEHMAEAIRSGGGLEAFAYRKPPEIMTRMLSVKSALDEERLLSIIMDTGPAALFGAALDPRYQEPAMVINFGNGHTVAAIMDDGGMTALFEHHTSELGPEMLRSFADRLASGELKNSEVFDDGGHGAYIDHVPERIRSVLVTGPRRDWFLRSGALKGAVAAAPAGDMMITGCLGLVKAWSKKDDLWR